MNLKDLAEGLYIEEYSNGEKDQIRKLTENEELILAYKSLLKNPDGKRVLWDILQFCEVFQNAMTGNSFTYFKLGKASVGQYIMLALNIGNALDDVLEFKKLRPDKKDGKS